jgi:hypothetical protein
MTDFQPGVNSSSLPLKRHLQVCNNNDSGQNSFHTALLERVQQLRSTSPAETKQKIEQMLQGYSMGGSCSEIDPKFNNGGPAELSLVDEEKSLQYIEISLQEVSREVQRRREEARMKRS